MTDTTSKKYTGKLDEAAVIKLLTSTSIIDDIDESIITRIESDCQTLYEKDEQSCQEWRNDAKDLLDMAKLKDKKREGFLQVWQSDLQLPDLIFSAMQFNARTYPEYVKSGKVCQPKTVGKFTEDKLTRAIRVCTHINWQLTTEMPEWMPNFDKMLLILPIIGHAFKLTMWDDQQGRITDTLLLPDQVTVDNTPNNPDWQRRISVDMVVNQNTMVSRQASGQWRNIDVECTEGTDEDKKYRIVQMHAWFDLDGDEYQEPYILTFNKSDWKLLSIVPRFDADSLVYKFEPTAPEESRELIGIEAVNYLTSYEYCPSPDGSALGMGLGHVIQGMARVRNASINQIQDAGTLMNLGGGWIKKGAFRDDGAQIFTPGEYKIADGIDTASSLADSFFKLPVTEPSTATYNTFTTLGEFINRIASTGEIMSGEGAPATMPATSVLAIIQQGKMGTTAVLTRINNSLTKEFKAIYRLNKAYLTNKKYLAVGDFEGEVVADDYDSTDFDIEPIADPSLSTKSERIMQHKAAMEAGVQSPLLLGLYLIDLGYDEKMAKQLAGGWAEMTQMAAQAKGQMEMLTQQEKTLAQQERTAKAERDRLELQLRLMEAESRAKLEHAQMLKVMAEIEAMQTEQKTREQDALIDELAALPPAIPTPEELADEQPRETDAGGVQPVDEQPDNQSGAGQDFAGSGAVESPVELPADESAGRGGAEGPGAGDGSSLGLGIPESGNMPEGE